MVEFKVRHLQLIINTNVYSLNTLTCLKKALVFTVHWPHIYHKLFSYNCWLIHVKIDNTPILLLFHISLNYIWIAFWAWGRQFHVLWRTSEWGNHKCTGSQECQASLQRLSIEHCVNTVFAASFCKSSVLQTKWHVCPDGTDIPLECFISQSLCKY